MTTVPKCQAKNPALCVDPQCPEKQFHAGVSRAARNNVIAATSKVVRASTPDEMFAARTALETAQFEFNSTREGIKELEEAYADATDDFEKGKLYAHLEMAKERFATKYGDSKVDTSNDALIPSGEHTYDVPTYTTEDPSDPNYNAYYPSTVGSKYTGYRPVTEIIKDVRNDIKEAQDKGYLPKHLRFSVKKGSAGSWSSAIDIDIQGASDAKIYTTQKDRWGEDAQTDTPEAKELRNRVEIIAKAYNQSRTNSQIDYFDETYYTHVRIEDERGAAYRAKEAGVAKAKREAAKKVTGLKNSFKTTPSEKWLKAAEPTFIRETKSGAKISHVPNSGLLVVDAASGVRVFDLPKRKRSDGIEYWASRIAMRDSNELDLIEQYEVK